MHAREFFRGRRAISEPQLMNADGSGPDERSHVRPEREGLEDARLERFVYPRLEAEGFERVAGFEVTALYRRRR